MASLTIRNLDDSLKAKLRLRAARHGRSMEEEARQLLRQGLVTHQPSTGLGSRISGRFRKAGGVELPEATRAIPQVLILPSLDRRLQKAAERARVSKGEWVRRAIEGALANPRDVSAPVESLARLGAPTGDIEQMLAEIEAGRG